MASLKRVSIASVLRWWKEIGWQKRKEEEYTPKPTAAPPTSQQLAKEEIPMPPSPATSPQLTAPPGSTLIGKSAVLKGQIHSREDLYIEGEVEGGLELPEHRLTVSLHGKVQANIKAREVLIAGTVDGNVEAAEKIDIRKEAKLIGDIKTASILIEDGAYFKGSIDISKPEVGRSAGALRPEGTTEAAAAATTGSQ